MAGTATNARPHPPSFYCPISHQCMHDPVVLSDGHTYERIYIERWLQTHVTSPVSGMELASAALVPNHALRNAIEEYFNQVLNDHRQAIRSATARLRRDSDLSTDSVLVQTMDSLMECAVLINADLSVEHVLKRIVDEARSLVGAEVASVFLVDQQAQELYSTVNSTNSEIRIPIRSGVAGHVVFGGLPLIIRDAYNDSRFNATIDSKTGFHTRNILCVPVKAWQGRIIGVVQLVNKTADGVFTASSSDGSHRLGFTTSDQQFLEVMASQAGAAIMNSGMFEQANNDAVQKSTPVAREGPSLPSASLFARSSSTTSLDAESAVTRQESLSMRMVPTCSGNTRIRRIVATDAMPMWDKLGNEAVAGKSMRAVKPLLAAALQSWQMDTLALSELTHNKPLQSLAEYIFIEHGLMDTFAIDHQKLACFLATIEHGYPQANPYHNRAHAASVLHFMHAFLHRGGVGDAVSAVAADISDTSRRHQFIVLVGVLAAIVHDYEHEGVTNDFLVKTFSEKAICHNDKSPNENHHVSAAFEVLLQPECNFLTQMTKTEFKLLRKLIVDLVLATDMVRGNDIIAAFQKIRDEQHMVGSSEKAMTAALVEVISPEAAMTMLQMALKCADMGHLALAWSLHMQWVRRLETEFFSQGDQEKDMLLPEVSFLMDRDKPGVTETQVGFFKFVAFPLFRPFVDTFPKTDPVLFAVEENYQRWCEIEA